MIDVQRWLTAGGLAVLAAVVFAESGLLIGFFLPGDTLLFVAGFLSSAAGGRVLPSLPITAVVAFVAAAAGDQVGYLIGQRLGPNLFQRPKSRLFKPANVQRARTFFDHRGPGAVVIARFIPVVRTFVPIIAGVGSMRYRTFVTYNLIGAALWAGGITTLGYLLGEVQIVKDNLDYAAILILLISLVPIAVEYMRHRGIPAAENR
jgi:membrane-associated protein